MSILPQQAAKVKNSFHQELSWKVPEEKWRNDEGLVLQLDTRIPGSVSHGRVTLGGCVLIYKRRLIAFKTQWPKKDVDLKNIKVEAVITFKLSNGKSVSFKCDKRYQLEAEQFQGLSIAKAVKVDVELLYDEEMCFVIEAELKVTRVDTNDDELSKQLKGFVSEIGSIFDDSKTLDVVVIAGNEKFNCHKNILSARCEVFKNMLAPHTSENENDTIEIREVPSGAVRTMLTYIYKGEVPDTPEKLTLDLLNLAEMYLLDHLKEACVKNLVEKLEVSSCITTFQVAERFNSGNLKEVVMEFIKCKAEEVVETEDCAKLLKTDPGLAQELMKVLAKGSKEKHKCQFCVISYPKKRSLAGP